ncbi:MAG: AAA family ATPase [Desulfobacteraceae bacterium]|nr:AAA family ATPase [Desulfobacteraceae bacterium]
MYESFYNLNKKPFQISSDPSFMWFGEKHKEALATLKYGILDNKGFLLLTGDVGTGKTTLINALTQSLSDDVICTTVPDPGLEKLDFFNYIAAAFDLNQEFLTKGTFLVHFRKFLIKANENNKKVLLIIDEAQLLTQELLEEIRLLSNIEKTDTKLINIFFIGQNEFNEILSSEQNRAVRQRLTLNYNIDPLTPDETSEYIKYRLNVAGASDSIFNESATQEVFFFSGGFPRRINVICDHCLLSGYVNEQKIINSSIVKECAKELKIPAHVKHRDINGFANYNEESIPAAKPHSEKSNEVKTKTTDKKRGYKIFQTGIVVLLFVFATWLFLFSNNFYNCMTIIKNNMVELSYNLLQIDPDPSSPIKQNNELKTNKTKAINEQIFTKKIQPVSKEIVKKDGHEQMAHLQTTENFKKKGIENKPENQLSTKDAKNNLSFEEKLDQETLTTDNKILPLPSKKIVVRFKYNTNDFTEEGFKRLVEFADILATHPETKILISGYTDSKGFQKYNRKLSEFRANIVGSFFLGKGIKSDQIQITGLGSKNPVESNNSSWGRMMNRRVEIDIIN